MKKIILTVVFAVILLNFANSQNVWVPASTVLNSGSASNVGIGIPTPTSTLQVDGIDVLFQVGDVLFEGNNFRTGIGNSVSGSVSGALGENNQVTNNTQHSFALGNEHILDASESSVILGEGNMLQNGHGSVSIGGHNTQNGYYTYAFGQGLTVGNPLGSTSRIRLHTIAMGSGLINNTANSLMVGFSSSPTTIPTLFVGKAGGTGPDRVGVNLLNPQEDLHVDGVIRSNSLAGTGTRGVCADSDGNLIISGACGGGLPDNLGNHVATQELNMSCENIIHVEDLEFCNNMFFSPANIIGAPIPNELVLNGGALGIGVSPSSRGTWAATGNPATLAVAGDIWANGAWYFSDKRFKKNIDNLSSALDKVKRMNGYSYEYKQEEFPEYNFSNGRTIGFIAQELKEISPELVQQTKAGYYSVNYTGVIPILTEAIKEQQEIIEEKTNKIEGLENRLSRIEALLGSELKSSEETITDKVVLKQNRPNPLRDETIIEYDLPRNTAAASIVVTDISGKTIKQFSLGQMSTKLTINTSSWTNGTYFYTLVVDGKTQDTKKMLIQK